MSITMKIFGNSRQKEIIVVLTAAEKYNIYIFQNKIFGTGFGTKVLEWNLR
jgi:hypothetical protein